MHPQLQKLLEEKITIYESIITELKQIDTEVYFKFHEKIIMIESIDDKLNSNPELIIDKIMKMSL